ncbi:DM DNA binding domain protein [Trichuris suis]|nr:DM DNA binding domain protein [Trichuris suis]
MTGKSRNPKCARCGVHNRQAEPPPLKGHKKVCPYQHCNCYKCQLVTQRRSVMARQIHLRRSQKARQSNGSTATMAIEGDIANKMLPLGQADVVGPLPMNVAPAVNNSYSMDMMMPTSPLMGHPTLPSMAEHSHPALVIPSRPTPTYPGEMEKNVSFSYTFPPDAVYHCGQAAVNDLYGYDMHSHWR